MHEKLRKLCRSSFNRIKEEGLHGVDQPPPMGTRRGIDVLGEAFDETFAISFNKYRLHHQKRPNLFNPKTFTEKQVLFKFFGPIPDATPSDKLRSPAYAPLDVRHLVKLPKRLFIYDTPRLPADDEIKPGSYFFKSNHGSGTNLRVRFPMSASLRDTLEAKARRWLTKVHNAELGLWWYESMPRNVYIEEDLGSEIADAADWKFFVCNGRVEIFQVDVDRFGDHVQTIYDRDGNFLPQELYFRSGNPVEMPTRLDDMLRIAEAIGRNFDFVRVDMFIKGQDIYLGEIGLVPNGATRAILSPELDERLGAAWAAPWFGKVGKDFPGSHYSTIERHAWEW